MKIVIVDYGMGNIKSIESTLKYLGVEDVILSSSFIFLPRHFNCIIDE